MVETQMKDPILNPDQNPDLGKSLANFSVEQWGLKRWSLLIFGAILTLGSVLFIFYLGFEVNSAIQRHGRAALLGYFPMPFAPAVLLIPLGGMFILTAWLHWQNGITLFERGLRHRKGRRTHLWLWEDFERLDTRVVNVQFSGSTIASRCRIILEDRHNHRWIIRGHYEQMDSLINKIRQQVIPIIYQKTVQRLVAGETIVFGKKLKAIRNGLKINDAFSPWVILDVPEISNATFLLKSKDTQELLFKSRVEKITNLDSLIHLIKYPPPPTDQSSPR